MSRVMSGIAAVLALMVVLAPTARAGVQTLESAASVAIYSNDLALVTVRHTTELNAGETVVTLAPISPAAVPGSLDLQAEGVRLLQQRLLPWPIDRQRLLQAFVGEEVTLIRPTPDGEGREAIPAELLSADGPLLLRVDGRVMVDPAGEIAFPHLPEGLRLDPAAELRLQVAETGPRTLTLRYLSRGLSWQAEYVARWNDAAGTLALTGLARIDSGLARPFRADSVRLVAGDVALSPEESGPQPRRAQAGRVMAMDAAAAAPMPEAESRADLKLYRLPGALALPPGGQVQRPLLRAAGVAAETRYRLTGLATAYPHRELREGTAELRLLVPDTRSAGLTQALPAGTVRVYDGEVFRGALRVGDTPLGGELKLDLGSAFDVTARARTTDYTRLGERSHEVAQAITIENAKAQPVEVRVVGDFPPEWEILSESHTHSREAATQPVWTVRVPAEGEAALTYRARVRR